MADFDVDALVSIVKDLHSLLLLKDSCNYENLTNCLTDLKHICLFDILSTNYDLCCSVLFDKQKGVLSLLQLSAYNQDVVQSNKTFLLEFLSAFIQKVGKTLLPYSVEIKNVCVSVYIKDRAAKVKIAALSVVIKLLEICVGSRITEEMKIPVLRDRLFSELTSSKLVPSVKRQLYILMGVISEVSPENMVTHSDRLLSLYISALKTEMTAKTRKPEMQVIAGCLEGLTSCLINFTQSVEEDSKFSYDIFKASRSCVSPEVDTTRYIVQKAALTLIVKHSPQFSQFLIDDHESMYNKLHYWTCHKNREMQHSGEMAMEAFLQQICHMLTARAAQGNMQGTVFKFFMLKLRTIMEDTHASSKQISLAIRGYGLLASPCRVFLNQSDVQIMLADMIRKSEQHFMRNSEMMDEKILSLPSYLTALANIVKQLEQISNTSISALIQLVVLLFEHFPSFHHKMHYSCIKALIHVLLAVQPKTASFHQLLTAVVYQGVIRSCSHPVAMAATDDGDHDDMPEEQQIFMRRKISYRDYIYLWTGLLDSPVMKDLTVEGVGLQERVELTQNVFDELVSSTLRIMSLLDFTSTHAPPTTREVENEVTTSDVAALHAVKPKDFQVFINLVDFTKEVLPGKQHAHFEKWLFTYGHKLIQMSSAHPSVSGFYKLLALCMTIANKLSYFTESPRKESQNTAAQFNTHNHDNTNQVDNCRLLFTKFTKEVLGRMHQYRDDLLAACLTFILSLPTVIVISQFANIVPALQVAFSVGQSYLPLASLGLDALEQWSRTLSHETLEPYYHEILPCLEAYLNTRDQGAEDVGHVMIIKTENKKGRANIKVPTRLIRAQVHDSDKSGVSQLWALKQRILHYLGSLGGRINHALLSNIHNKIEDVAIAWDTQQHLRFEVPFVDMKPVMYLDMFLPRVVSLARHSSDRQTKVVACELLHSLVIYAVGRGVQQPASTSQPDCMEATYRKLFPSILRLACDTEKVAQQLFDPLMMQLIHWFTGNKLAESPETVSLLDTIFDGVIETQDSTLRDYSARCLREFLKWSIKQGHKNALVNTKSILKRLYSYCLHSSTSKRLGAALAFNNIYTVFREEKQLVDIFTFEILYHFVDSLALANADDKSLGTQEQCGMCLTHLERIIAVNAAMLGEKSSNRTEPRAWSKITVEFAVCWLLQQCGRPQTECRHACMKLVCKLAPLVKGMYLTKNFFETFLKSRGPSYFIERLALVRAEHPSQIFVALNYFLEKFSSSGINEAASVFNSGATTFTPCEIDQYNRCKCTVVIRTFNFLVVLLQSFAHIDKNILSTLLREQLWSVVCLTTLQPVAIGFNMAEVEVMMSLPKEMEQTLLALHKLLPAAQMKGLIKAFTTFINECGGVGHFSEVLKAPLIDEVSLDQSLSGYHILHKAGLLTQVLPSTISTAAQQLFDAVFQGVLIKDNGETKKAADLSPSIKNIYRKMLTLSFQLALPAETVLWALFDKTRVQGLHHSWSSLHGELFYSHYKDEISVFVAKRARSIVPLIMDHIQGDPRQVSSILEAALDCLIRDKSQRSMDGVTMVSNVLSQWGRLEVWWTGLEELQHMVYGLISKLFVIDATVISDPNHKAFPNVFAMYKAFLTDRKTSLAFKSDTFNLLPFFCNVSEPYLSKLQSILDSFVADNFPLKSREYNMGSRNHNDYIAALDKLGAALELCGSPILLRLVTSILCREPMHIHETAIDASLTRFMKRLPRASQRLAIDVAHAISQSDMSLSPVIRSRVVDKVLLPLLRVVRCQVVVEYMQEHIAWVVSVVEAKLTRNETLAETQLYDKICAFHLIELMYSRLEIADTHSMTSVINDSLCSSKGIHAETGKEMTQAVTKAASDAKGEDTRGETILVELSRIYHCMAYNALVAIITCIQTDVRFYAGFLFKENETKGHLFYDNIIDNDKTYEFHLELSSPMERKKKLVSIRLEVKEESDDLEENSGVYHQSSSSVHLATQYLADSSLISEIHGFNTLTQAQQSSLGDQVKEGWKSIPGISTSSSTDDRSEATVQENYVVLEVDELNQHECMATMIGLLNHMHHKKIMLRYEKGASAPSVPAWMENMVKRLASNSTHVNIKLFLAKLIVNLPHIFEPYAKYLFRGLLQVIVSGQFGAGGLNCLVLDIVVTMISWHQTAIPADTSEERVLASRVLEYLMIHCYHINKQIFRNNIDMLKSLLTCWKSCVIIPYKVIYGLFHSTNLKSKQMCAGIQILGVVLENQFDPYGPDAPVDRQRYLEKLAQNLNGYYLCVYGPAAEVVGMVLQYVAIEESNPMSQFHEYVANHLVTLHSLSNLDKFIVCVHAIHKHHPSFTDKFINKLLFILPGLHGNFRCMCLEMLLSRIDNIDDVYMHLKQKSLHKLLETRNESTQLICLKIVRAMVKRLKVDELGSLMASVTSFETSQSAPCRSAMYSILMWIYDRYRDNDSDESQKIMTDTKDVLLKGLADEDLHCRVELQNFWTSDTRLPSATLDRLVAMLEAMYSSSTESHYLAYCTNLLLHMTSNSPDFSRSIFEHPLSECTFHDYNIESSWRQRHLAMTPLFVHTQMWQSVGESFSNTHEGQIRATIEGNAFTPTQASSDAPYNWLTQTSLDTLPHHDPTDFCSASSSRLFTMNRPAGRTKSRISRPANMRVNLKKPSSVRNDLDQLESKDSSDDIWRLKRRFIKDSQSDASFFMRLETRKKELRWTVERDRKARREHHVTMYRRYRIGDLPDIQIKYSYIITPLQALAQRDSTIAKLLFSALSKAIFDQMDMRKTEREVSETIGQINKSLEVMLDSSTQFSPQFVSCILDIIHSLQKKLNIDHNLIGSCALASNLQPLGIVVLEDKLMVTASDHEPRPSKRAKFSTPSNQLSADIDSWLVLARLYKSVGEFDVLTGIFNGKIRTCELTTRGMEAEGRLDYSEAFRIYSSALQTESWEDEDPTQAEWDLWHDAFMKCCENLSRWSTLEEISTQYLDKDNDHPRLASVWEDTYSQEHILQPMLRSKLKLMLSGDVSQQSLLDFIDSSMENPLHKAVLENRYCQDLALMYVWQENYDRAKHYCRLATHSFLQDWYDSSELVLSPRVTRLQGLQALVELDEFLTLMASANGIWSMEKVERLLVTWETRSAHMIMDSMSIWSDIMDNRRVYMNHMSRRHSKAADPTETDAEQRFMSLNCQFQLDLARAAQSQGNYSLTLKTLKDIYTMCRRLGDESTMVKWNHLHASTHQQKESVSKNVSIASAITTLDQLGKVSSSECLGRCVLLNLHHHLLLARGCEILIHELRNKATILDEQLNNKLMLLAGCESREKHVLIMKLMEKGYEHYNSGMLMKQSWDKSSDVQAIADAHVKLSNFCDKLLRDSQDGESITFRVPSNYPDKVVECLLISMKMGSVEACYRYPRILQIAEYFPHTIALICDKCAEVPSWTFIPWISQMLSVSDKSVSLTVQHTLLELAQHYPHAVIYPFKISKDSFTFTSGDAQTVERNIFFVDKLSSMLTRKQLPLISTFIAGLAQFTQAEHVFKDWKSDISKELSRKVPSKEAIKGLYEKMHSALLQTESDETLSTLSTATKGDYRKQFAQKYIKKVEDILGKDGYKLLTMSNSEFLKKIDPCYKEMTEKSLKPPEQLNKYSHWMANFNCITEHTLLEIPGQYTGFSKPTPEYHVKIAGFDQRVKVMTSICKPKRITIRGNDENDYKFLVKGGEDLRQDQRIEQLFVLMNHVFERDAACKQRRLSLVTYKVVPITNRIGLIEWIDNTAPLKEFLLGAMTKEEKNYYTSFKIGPGGQHAAWLSKFAGHGKVIDQYRQMYIKASRTDVTEKFRAKESGVPWDLSRRAFKNMSTSAEAFYMLRDCCLRSYSLMCVSQYILGIGDRHLSNIMVDMTTGRMIGIDFGHAFGTATQFLPVPELMPMRLTRQIRNLGYPLEEQGLVKCTMIHGLCAIRKDCDLLLNTMDVFINEPSVDWLTLAARQKKEGMETSDADMDELWYPKQKIQYARRKLDGDHPAQVICDEVTLGQSKSPALKYIMAVTLGDSSSTRAKLPKQGLSVEQQVSALIDQAMDANLLGRVYGGWEAWV